MKLFVSFILIAVLYNCHVSAFLPLNAIEDIFNPEYDDEKTTTIVPEMKHKKKHEPTDFLDKLMTTIRTTKSEFLNMLEDISDNFLDLFSTTSDVHHKNNTKKLADMTKTTTTTMSPNDIAASLSSQTTTTTTMSPHNIADGASSLKPITTTVSPPEKTTESEPW
ncbi:uncharacterized protein LOC142221715 [Haematobia irritans]|uniref:uncharacterized protein LOC142221715 n=1 Tax=Haematobia irritans TaxID=7368 RepID=UPI003F501F6F